MPFTLFLFLDLQDANINTVRFTPTECSLRSSGGTEGFSKLESSSDESASVCQVDSDETKPPQISDDSDSEIFRVKRRSTLSLRKRRAEIISDISQQKVFFYMQYIFLLHIMLMC